MVPINRLSFNFGKVAGIHVHLPRAMKGHCSDTFDLYQGNDDEEVSEKKIDKTIDKAMEEAKEALEDTIEDAKEELEDSMDIAAHNAAAEEVKKFNWTVHGPLIALGLFVIIIILCSLIFCPTWMKTKGKSWLTKQLPKAKNEVSVRYQALLDKATIEFDKKIDKATIEFDKKIEEFRGELTEIEDK